MRMLTRWEPRNEMTFNRNLNRVFDDFFGRSLQQRGDEGSLCGNWVPAVNIVENGNGLEISVDLPGMDPKNVEVTVEDGVLSISGERSFNKEDENDTFHRVERSYGSFERRFTVPTTIDAAKIEARFKNGVMTLSLPKREESKPKAIKVKVESK